MAVVCRPAWLGRDGHQSAQRRALSGGGPWLGRLAPTPAHPSEAARRKEVKGGAGGSQARHWLSPGGGPSRPGSRHYSRCTGWQGAHSWAASRPERDAPRRMGRASPRGSPVSRGGGPGGLGDVVLTQGPCQEPRPAVPGGVPGLGHACPQPPWRPRDESTACLRAPPLTRGPVPWPSPRAFGTLCLPLHALGLLPVCRPAPRTRQKGTGR